MATLYFNGVTGGGDKDHPFEFTFTGTTDLPGPWELEFAARNADGSPAQPPTSIGCPIPNYMATAEMRGGTQAQQLDVKLVNMQDSMNKQIAAIITLFRISLEAIGDGSWSETPP